MTTTKTLPKIKRPWFLGHHCLLRMNEMALRRSDITEVLEQFETRYPGSVRYPKGRCVATKGRLAVVYEPQTKTVVTVLWNGLTSREEGLNCE